jgi:protein-tyrosine kinase
MSKFFKALEQAERERAQRKASTESDTQAAVPTGEAPAEVPAAGAQRESVVRPVRRSMPVPERIGTESPPASRAVPPVKSASPASTADHAGPAPTRSSVAHRKESDDRDVGRGPSLVDHDPAAVDEHLVSLLSATSFAAEQYRALRLAIEQRPGLEVIAVTSPDAGDGKTTTAINLGGALAQSTAHKVLLVEADLRHPSIAGRLGLDASDNRGLADLVRDPSLSTDRFIRHLPAFNLAVLPAGRRVENGFEVLRSPRLGQILADLRSRYQFVIVDVPPLLPFPDCRVIGDSVDGFIVVVAAHKTTPKRLEETLGMLERDKIIGLVFNRNVTASHYPDYPDPSDTPQSGWRRSQFRSGTSDSDRGAGRWR